MKVDFSFVFIFFGLDVLIICDESSGNMECHKLAKRIQDWTNHLGFTLDDGSAPPLSYFSLLTATPHRRQLWEALIDFIQPRQKIEHMRKQILVGKLLKKNKYYKKTTLKQQTDRLDLWQEQNKLETELKEKENSIIKLERSIMAKVSDALFEICKLSELEKQLEEFSEKSVVLRLLSKRKKKLVGDFESCLLKVKGSSCLKDDFENSVGKGICHCTESDLLTTPECECPPDGNNCCRLLHKIQDLCESGITEKDLWEEVIKCKRNILDKFSEFLEDVNSNEKSVLSGRRSEVEKSLSLSIAQLKQKATEKSLQIIVNSTEGKLLEAEVGGLEDRVLDELFRKPRDELSLNESISFLEMKKSDIDSEKTEKNFKNYLSTIGLQSYLEFLKEELKKLEDLAMAKGKNDREDTKGGTEELQLTLNTFESVVEDINLIMLERSNIEKEIFRLHERLQSLRDSLENEFQAKSEMRSASDAAEKLKSASEQQIALLLQTPSDVFRTVETSSGRTFFERDSPAHCLKNYGGELKQFFTAMLIPPPTDLQIVLQEVERRQKAVKELKSFLSERQNLAAVQKKVKNNLGSIKYDTDLCERNYNKSDGVLANVLRKTDEVSEEIEFIEKILKNWVEQPYELMIKETTAGKNFKEYEEKYRKDNKE